MLERRGGATGDGMVRAVFAYITHFMEQVDPSKPVAPAPSRCRSRARSKPKFKSVDIKEKRHELLNWARAQKCLEKNMRPMPRVRSAAAFDALKHTWAARGGIIIEEVGNMATPLMRFGS